MKFLSVAVLAMTLGLAGCGALQTVTPLERTLPDWPAMCQPVKVKDPKTGEEILVIAARERAGRIAANKTIASCEDWYKDVQSRYGGAR